MVRIKPYIARSYNYIYIYIPYSQYYTVVQGREEGAKEVGKEGREEDSLLGNV